MKRLLLFVDVVMLSGLAVVLAAGTGFAAPPPPPPPPAVPAGDVLTQFAAGGGIAAYGAYRLWKAKRAVKKMEEE
jgi:hypothetical protein